MDESSATEGISGILDSLVGSLPAVDFGAEDSDEVILLSHVTLCLHCMHTCTCLTAEVVLLEPSCVVSGPNLEVCII